MTTYAERPTINLTTPAPSAKGKNFVKWITSTDHKVIGYLYLMTTFAWFLVAGLLALILRAELARPGMQFLSNEQYNQIFTMHGTIMLLMFATPLFVGFANVKLVQQMWPSRV
jgi:cytochrome c oxidase subunit 1